MLEKCSIFVPNLIIKVQIFSNYGKTETLHSAGERVAAAVV